jgi:hypothetical protein
MKKRRKCDEQWKVENEPAMIASHSPQSQSRDFLTGVEERSLFGLLRNAIALLKGILHFQTSLPVQATPRLKLDPARFHRLTEYSGDSKRCQPKRH